MRGFRLGRILGVEVRIDRSWFIIFFLILWTFTAGVFPAGYPGHGPGTYAAMGVAGTLLFFASLLAHELAHSVVARRRGIPVEGITLFVFGGIAHARMEAERPGDEFVIAGVGPLSSLLIGALFGAAGAVGRWAGLSPAITGVAAYLSSINIVLALFNLLPGFPLDGGRLFRAAAWKVTGDATKATRWATAGGAGLGYALIAVGALQLILVGNLVGGVWLMFIGWFLRSAAEASMTQHLLLGSLEGVYARDLMSPRPETVPAALGLDEFVEEYLVRGRHSGYPVLDSGRTVGLMTLERVRAVPRAEWSRRTVADAMLPLNEELTVRPQESMASVLEKLGRAAAGRVLVTCNGNVEGVITQGDLARWFQRLRLLARN
ncbi:MAG TPA: site-2 protease family protein [Longimicrobiales bacterium]